MGRIWVRMLAIYGHKWASHLGYALDDAGLLSESAKTWQAGLCGVSPDNLRTAFDALVLKHHDWPPSLPEFRALCLSKAAEGVPSLDEVVARLVMVSNRRGSLAARYGHPLVLAIARQDSVDMFAIRTAKTGEARRMVKDAYEHCLETGWLDWRKADLKEPDGNQKALEHNKPRNKSVGMSALSAIRCAL